MILKSHANVTGDIIVPLWIESGQFLRGSIRAHSGESSEGGVLKKLGQERGRDLFRCQ